MQKIVSAGPVILDLEGTQVSAEEKDMLQHPLIGGVILFSRNFESKDQITQLCHDIRQARAMPLLITVDHEGGRVQRFREGFTKIPCMRDLGQHYEKDPTKGLELAQQTGWQIATELLAIGIDLSFAPVLDLDKGLNTVIADRAFHRQSNIVVAMAKAVIEGMHKAGMAATGKHFPGHGAVTVDSHLAMPIDERDLAHIMQDDMVPFIELIQSDIDALMPAHILFPAVDDKPVGFSARWIKDILRQQLNFTGVIFSDDLNMQGASPIGDHAARAVAALSAGCDFILTCNNREGAVSILDQLPHTFSVSIKKFNQLRGKISQ